jgi:mono/diheme cytochrome c family protein
MEEEEFPRVLSDEFGVLKKWVAGGAPPWPEPEPGDQPPDEAPSVLAIQTKEIFREKCYRCHRFGNAKNGILILNHHLLVSKRKVIVPGQPDSSSLYQSLFLDDPNKVMPPKKSKPLTPAEKATIRRYIAEGAPPFPREHKARLPDTAVEPR